MALPLIVWVQIMVAKKADFIDLPLFIPLLMLSNK
jgi:hypothetical protein